MSIANVYERQGFGQQLGIGDNCALVCVDFVNGFVDPAVLGSVEIELAAQRSVEILKYFRSRNLPVAHTRVVFDEGGADHNLFSHKVPKLKMLTETAYESQIVNSLSPITGELLIRKQSASAFFGTNLANWLFFKKSDTIFVIGCTTSGCIRATVIDSMQHNFKTIVVTDCVADRAQEPHLANLFDMEQKYADLMDLSQSITSLEKSMERT
jgi:maleamate amidohydrolase